MEINRLSRVFVIFSLWFSLVAGIQAVAAYRPPVFLPPDTVKSGNVDSLAVFRYIAAELRRENALLRSENRVLSDSLGSTGMKITLLNQRQNELKTYNDSLSTRISGLSRQLELRSGLLEEQLKLLKDKELLFAEKEQLYKEALSSSMVDKMKLEGQISSRDSRLDGKDREISLLQLSIDEKSRDIDERNAEIRKIADEKVLAVKKADTLMHNLNQMEKKLLLTGEQLKYTELKLKDCENRYSSVTNKKKKTRVVQGFAIKNYRTPDFALAPKDAANPSVYVISNNNSSNIEFDFVTGASIMLKDLTKPGGNLTYDVGFFLGFGGNNLFKNFYLGPNVKLFDVLHVNVGANVAEYTALKEGFNVGDVLQPGITIPTTKEWKVNAYIGFTFDLDLISMIGKR